MCVCLCVCKRVCEYECVPACACVCLRESVTVCVCVCLFKRRQGKLRMRAGAQDVGGDAAQREHSRSAALSG